MMPPPPSGIPPEVMESLLEPTTERLTGLYAVRYLSKTFWAGLVIGFVSFCIFTLFGIWVTVQIPVALNDAPLTYHNTQWDDDVVLCPGQLTSFETYVDIVPGSMISTFWVIAHAEDGSNVLGTQGRIGPRLYPNGLAITTTIPVAIPLTLPPGHYKHIRGNIEVNKDSEPAWLELPFEVKACE